MMDSYAVEYTDTFAGEANYCWIKRATISIPAMASDNIYTSAATICRNRRAYDRQLMRKAKAAMGLTGIRGRKESYGDSIAFYPYGMATVLFINWKESSDD